MSFSLAVLSNASLWTAGQRPLLLWDDSRLEKSPKAGLWRGFARWKVGKAKTPDQSCYR